MRNAYREFYPPTESELADLWRDAFFTFDANVLLNLYRMRRSDDYLNTFAELKERIWLSHQAGREYHVHRLSVIHDMSKMYRELLEDMEKSLAAWRQRYPRHPAIDLEQAWKLMGRSLEEVRQMVGQAEKDYPNLEHKDPILDKLGELFSGRVGVPFSATELPALYKEAESRYQQKIPPGYLDEKPSPKKYGDFVLWKQVCMEAKKRGGPVILITDERKDDWWSKLHGKVIGPRPELMAEIGEQAGVRFHMYSSDQFLHFADKYLKKRGQLRQVEQEAKSLREAEERQHQAEVKESRSRHKAQREQAQLKVAASLGKALGNILINSLAGEAKSKPLVLVKPKPVPVPVLVKSKPMLAKSKPVPVPVLVKSKPVSVSRSAKVNPVNPLVTGARDAADKAGVPNSTKDTSKPPKKD